MALTLLEIVQAATTELAIVAVPSAVVTSPALQNLQFLGLANALGRELVTDYEWQKDNGQWLFNTIAYSRTATATTGSKVVTVSDTSNLTSNFGVMGTGVQPWAQIVSVDSPTQITMSLPATQSNTGSYNFSQNQYDLPADFDSYIDDTAWDRTSHWPLMGPQSAQDWAQIKGGLIATGPRMRYRFNDGQFLLNPNPANNFMISLEYVSNGWVRNGSGVMQTAFSSDGDTCIFDDQLMITGLKMKWLQAKGLEWGYVADEFARRLNILQAKDKGSPVLSISREAPNILLGPWNIPDGNWGRS